MNNQWKRFEGLGWAGKTIVIGENGIMARVQMNQYHAPLWFWVIPFDEEETILQDREDGDIHPSTLLNWEEDEENDLEYYGEDLDEEDEDDLEDIEDEFDEDIDEDLDEEIDEDEDDFLDDEDDLDDDFVDIDEDEEII